MLYPTELRALARRRILTKNAMKTHCLFFVCVNPNRDGLTSLDFIKHNDRYAIVISTGTSPQAIAFGSYRQERHFINNKEW